MTKDNRKKVKIESEPQKNGISNMIDEGGIGAEKYYDIRKPSPSFQNKTNEDKPEKESN